MPRSTISSELLVEELAVVYFFLNSFDALLTLYAHALGVPELNPIWAALLDSSPVAFLFLKCAVGFVVLCLLQKISSIALAAFALVVYGSLVTYTFVNLLVFCSR